MHDSTPEDSTNDAVAWYDSPLFDAHRNATSHPERPARLAAIREGLADAGLDTKLVRLEPTPLNPEVLLRIHDPQYVAFIEKTCREGGGLVAMDSGVVPASWSASLMAGGACWQAAQDVVRGRFRRAFCSVRPPGHHAIANRAMGYCLFCNAAIAAEAALACPGIARVAILDWDVHHGNGTQDAFYTRGDVLYASIHEYPSFPGTGAAEETGEGAGAGLTVNCPVPKGSGNDILLRAWHERIRPALEAFGPDILIVSAGFDADVRDPIGKLEVTATGFRSLSEQVVRWADCYCQGRLVSLLEGGYAFKALKEDVALHVETLLA